MAREGFHDVLFPLDVALGARGGPTRRTDVVQLASGDEVRRARWSRSLRRWDVAAGVRSLADAERILSFFEAREGRRFAFAFRDPFDHASGQAGADPLPTDQEIGTGDGETVRFHLSKTSDGVVRSIDLAREGSVRVAVGGVELPGGWSLHPLRDSIVFDAPPAEGQVVSAGFLFDVPARFDTDELVFEAGARGASIPSMILREVRI